VKIATEVLLMAIDIQLVNFPEYIGARPRSMEMYNWVTRRMQKYNIPYGWVELDDSDVEYLATHFADDPVAQMLVEWVKKMNSEHPEPGGPYQIELNDFSLALPLRRAPYLLAGGAESSCASIIPPWTVSLAGEEDG
jgi:hypothetical protein